MELTFTQAKLIAIDYTIVCPGKLRRAASTLLCNLHATAEDESDACDLIRRAQKIEKERIVA